MGGGGGGRGGVRRCKEYITVTAELYAAYATGWLVSMGLHS